MNRDIFLHLLEHLSGWVWQTSVQASVLIVLVLVVRGLFGKRLPARLGYVLGLLVLFRLMLPLVPASSFSLFNLGHRFGFREVPGKPTLPVLESSRLLPAQPDMPFANLSDPARPAKFASRVDARNVAGLAWLAGFIVSVFAVWRRHQRFSLWVAHQPVVEDPKLVKLLDECRSAMRVRQHLQIVRVPQPETPALFGWRSPRLLVPETTLKKLDERELRMVFLHELAHVKRGDILWNWIMLLVRSVHWFNPLVWLALRRLRADRELVCDAMVMPHLAADERCAYGRTLIKLLDEFSGATFCPSVAPVIGRHHEMKRRVTMIAQFTPANRKDLLLSAVIVTALCCLAFTRAADSSAPVTAVEVKDSGSIEPLVTKVYQFKEHFPSNLLSVIEPMISGRSRAVPDERTSQLIVVATQKELIGIDGLIKQLNASADPAGREGQTIADKGQPRTTDTTRSSRSWQESQAQAVQSLKKALEEQEAKLREARERVDKLRAELAVVDPNGNHVSLAGRLESDKIAAEAEYLKLDSLSKLLESRDRRELHRIINVAVPDELLTTLLKSKAEREQKLAGLSQKIGPENPEIKGLKEELNTINEQVNGRVEGIMAGLRVKAEAMQVQIKSLENALDQARAKDAEALARLQPYLEAKRDYENQQRIREAVQSRILQEQIDSASPNPARP